MKKLGQKVSFLTKIMLVIGLLISNLSSLSVVFAYEAAGDLIIDKNDNNLVINYIEELAEEVEAVNVKVYENYTYLDGSSEEEVVTSYSLNAEQLSAALDGMLELVHETIFAEEGVKKIDLFDGIYSAKVQLIDVTDYSLVEDETTLTEEEVQTTETDITSTVEENNSVVTETIIDEVIYEEEMTHESGLNIKLFDSNGTELSIVDGKYPLSVEYPNVRVVAQILSGGLSPEDEFVYNDVVYKAADLINLEFSSETDFGGRLFGEYELPIEVKVLKPLLVDTVEPETAVVTDENENLINNEQYEEVVYNNTVSIMYESYEENANYLNSVSLQEGYGESYLFYGDTEDGILYVLPDFNEENDTTELTAVTKTMLDVYDILNVALTEEDGVDSIITYTLFKDGVNVLESYVPASEQDTLETYLATITLDDTVQIILSNEGLDVTYRVVVVGDLNDDNIITDEDVLGLIDQVVGESEVTDLDKSDLYGFDGEVNSLDVLYLNQVVKSQAWNVMIIDEEVALDAALEVKTNGETLSEENYLTSGDEFTVEYVLSLTDYEVNGLAGVFNYDETLFELVSMEVSNEWIGNNSDGKFLYLGEESLTGPELEVPEDETPEGSENENTYLTGVITSDESEIVPIDYVVVTATFRALGATSEESNNIITLDEIELFNSTIDGVTYYVLDQTSVSTEAIEVAASEDNTLQYLEVAGIEIVLEDGVYDYEITVSNDVTAVDLKYILGNVAASITSEIYPEELVEGSNTIVITVTSETGVSQDYTITVVREEAKEETTTQVNYGSYSNNTGNNTTNQEVVTPEMPEEDVEEIEDEESNLSRIVIIILILIVIAGLVYLIFKDDDDETKKANKEVNKLKKQSIEPEVKVTNKTTAKVVDKKVSKNTTKTTSNKTSSDSKNKNSNKSSSNKKKER